MDTKRTHQLRKGKDIIGRKVVTLSKGRITDEVEELVYDPYDHYVRALVVDKGGWFSEAKVILFEDVRSIGTDAVTIESESVVRKASDVPQRISRIIKGDTFLTNNKVYTQDGTLLGVVSDIYFDTESGRVVELEVSQGMFENVKSGKKRIRVADVVKTGQDATIVKAYVDEQLEQQAQHQGVQGAVTRAQQKAPGIMDRAKDQMSQAADMVREKAQDLTEKTKQKAREIRRDPQTQARVGEAKERVGDAVDTASAKLRQARDSAKETYEEAKGAVEENQTKQALGTYLTRNIMTPDNKMLAKRGDMVTMDIIRAAQQHGMMDEVTGNTQKEPVDSRPTEPAPARRVDMDVTVKNRE